MHLADLALRVAGEDGFLTELGAELLESRLDRRVALPDGPVLVRLRPPMQAWLTPYPSARNLLSGSMSGMAWAQWGVVVALWVVGLNAAGSARVRRVSAVRA
ncbi:hypothetical protein I6J71_27435 [Amycolatopsis sp. FDAARGOS 1241]|nr:hypothetical protein [Amycolatopsis sp. FDAARGOS 1241]QRP43158.1 hypothetical protein I6J71_27435 [Amycolatopsis sp. FDAARGOS 1241]